jgi:membrane-associated phospholipid phosphatase
MAPIATTTPTPPSLEVLGPASTSPTGIVPPRVALVRARGASTAAVAGLAGFLGIFAIVRARRTEAVDLAVTLKLQRRDDPVIDRFMWLVSWPGFAPQSHVIPAAIIVLLWLARLRLEAGFQALGWGTALLSSVVKALMRRPRPVAGPTLRVVAGRLGGSSFPSGHVITYVGVYGFLGYLLHVLLRPARIRRAAVAGLLGLVALVGPSRIHQGHHWATDVTASYLLGMSYLIGLASLYRRVKARRAGARP